MTTEPNENIDPAQSSPVEEMIPLVKSEESPANNVGEPQKNGP